MCGFDGTDAGSRRGTINPYRGQPQRLGWSYVVIDALADMQHTMRRNLDPSQRKFKDLQRRFVSLGLLRGDDLIESNAQLGKCCREKIVIHVRKNSQAKAALQLIESRYGVGPGFPAWQRVGQRVGFFVRGTKSELGAEPANDGFQNFAIGMEFALLTQLFEVAIKFQERGIINLLAVGRQDAVQGGKKARFPIDQRAVTIEGENLEAAEVKHDAMADLVRQSSAEDRRLRNEDHPDDGVITGDVG